MEISASVKSRIGYLLTILSSATAVAFSIAVSKKGILWGEIGMSRWMHENTPHFVEVLGDGIDAPITDIGAPLIFLAISILIYWRWGRYATLGIVLAGFMTGLTRISDIVARSGPNEDFIFYTSKYIYGEGGYPSGHVVYAVMVFGMIAFLAEKHSKVRTVAVVKYSMFLLILLNLWTRISGLHHWPGDVIGGLLLSGPALLAVIWLYNRLPLIIKRSPKMYNFVLAGENS
jgi:membrane-associated phospholipid phosphatase